MRVTRLSSELLHSPRRRRRFQLQTLQRALIGVNACPASAQGVKIEESARRKTYSTVTHWETARPSFIAGLNSILQADRIAFSVSPDGSAFTTRTRATLPRTESKTFKVTNPCTPLRRASLV